MKNAILALGMLLGLNAHATGGFSCEYEKDGLTFTVGGVTSHGFASAVVEAGAEIKGKNLDQVFKREDMKQYWNAGEEFRATFYAEKELPTTYEYTQATVMTKMNLRDLRYYGTMTIEGSRNGNALPSENHNIVCDVE